MKYTHSPGRSTNQPCRDKFRGTVGDPRKEERQGKERKGKGKKAKARKEEKD